ncbi:MAG: hypothetical protein AAFZ07_20345 [Actinomycetota bacterium]
MIVIGFPRGDRRAPPSRDVLPCEACGVDVPLTARVLDAIAAEPDAGTWSVACVSCAIERARATGSRYRPVIAPPRIVEALGECVVEEVAS